MINILHISDFHYDNQKENFEQQKICEKIKDNLDSKIDLIIFSGDLVFRGDTGNFEDAFEMLVEPIRKKFELPKSNVIICSGNHDMNRNNKVDAIYEKVDEKIDNNDELDNYFNDKSNDFEYTINPLENYLKFENNCFKENKNILKVNNLFKVHDLTFSNKNLGIITINNSWRAIGKKDTGNLVYPIAKLKEATGFLKNKYDFKLLVMHHPLRDFKTYNSYDLEDYINQKFDLMFTGHYHKKNNEINFDSKGGILKISAPATLTENGSIGFNVVKIDDDDSTYRIENFIYKSNEEKFLKDKINNVEIPTTDLQQKENKFRRKIRSKFDSELALSSKLLVTNDSNYADNSFLKITTDPVLKENSSSEISENKLSSPDFDWTHFINNEKDYLILGKGKCGKTILLKKIQLELLKNYNQYDTIPFYIDLKNHRHKKEFDLADELRVYYEINRKDSLEILTNRKFILLIDNYHIDTVVFKNLIHYIESNNKFKVVACSEESIFKNLKKSKLNGRTFEKIYFHRLRKKHIKRLTDNIIDENNIENEQIVEKLTDVFKKLSIPFNFWSVSLFLWVFKRDLNKSLQNDVELINLYIEKLLEKDFLTIKRSSFGFDKYKRYLSALAYTLLCDFQKNTYSMNYDELVTFTQKYLDKNPRYTINARDVIEYVENRGVLLRKPDDRYTFRLKGVFEYFLANHLTFDDDFLNEIINDDEFYLSFSNEFELYAGFKRDDEVFLNRILNKTKDIFETISKKYEKHDNKREDSILISKIKKVDELKSMVEDVSNNVTEALTEDAKDKIEEEDLKNNESNNYSEVVKKERLGIDSSVSSLEKSLFILGRVFKNMDEIKSTDKVNDIFDYILTTSIYWGFEIIDSLNDSNGLEKSLKDDNDSAKKLISIIGKLIPTLVQTRLSEMISDKNLEKIIQNKIDELDASADSNQYKLFILYFLLLDIDLFKHKDKIDTCMDTVNIPIIKFSIIIKLNYYLGFKINKKDDVMTNFLRKRIKHQSLNFNNKSDSGSIDQNISETIKKKRLDG